MEIRHSLQTAQTIHLCLVEAIRLLELPQLELAEWLENEIEKNPLLEKEPFSSPPLPDLPTPLTLRNHLLNQLLMSGFTTSENLIATRLIDSLDERGFLTDPLSNEEEPIAAYLRTLDPPGIAARSLQQCLLAQLPPNTLAAQIIQHHYNDLLASRLTLLSRLFGANRFKQALKTISRLNFRPASLFTEEPRILYPDLTIEEEHISVEETLLPAFRLKSDYLHLKLANREEKELLQTWAASARFVIRSLRRRKTLLQSVGELLLVKQHDYLTQNGPLRPLALADLASDLHVHPSTISRLLAHKTVACARGLIPLRSLLSSSLHETSQKALLDALQTIIAGEDKAAPYSDAELASLLKPAVARRTVTKYRKLLQIGGAKQRKMTS
jgi:RNA polymerase sigma-54 factor